MNITANITDVRCKAGVAACGAANAADGADYTGELEGTAPIRITDHWNAVAPGGGPDAATVIDIPFPVNTPCTATAQHGNRQHVRGHHHGERGGAGRPQSRTPSGRSSRSASCRSSTVAPTASWPPRPNTLFEVQGIFIP